MHWVPAGKTASHRAGRRSCTSGTGCPCRPSCRGPCGSPRSAPGRGTASSAWRYRSRARCPRSRHSSRTVACCSPCSKSAIKYTSISPGKGCQQQESLQGMPAAAAAAAAAPPQVIDHCAHLQSVPGSRVSRKILRWPGLVAATAVFLLGYRAEASCSLPVHLVSLLAFSGCPTLSVAFTSTSRFLSVVEMLPEGLLGTLAVLGRFTCGRPHLVSCARFLHRNAVKTSLWKTRRLPARNRGTQYVS